MNYRNVFFVLMIILTSRFAVCQASVSAETASKSSVSKEEFLRQHNIGIDNMSLVEALQNTDPHVRWIAAELLASDGAKDATPAMVKALESEKDTVARVNIAYALARLGEERGVVMLKKICGTTVGDGRREAARLRAAEYLLDIGNEECFNAVIEMAQSNREGQRSKAISLLPRFRHISKEGEQNRVDVILQSLNDPIAMVRLEAAEALENLGNPATIPYLQTAVTSEHDKTVRSVLQNHLQNLQMKTQR